MKVLCNCVGLFMSIPGSPSLEPFFFNHDLVLAKYSIGLSMILVSRKKMINVTTVAFTNEINILVSIQVA